MPDDFLEMAHVAVLFVLVLKKRGVGAVTFAVLFTVLVLVRCDERNRVIGRL